MLLSATYRILSWTTTIVILSGSAGGFGLHSKNLISFVWHTRSGLPVMVDRKKEIGMLRLSPRVSFNTWCAMSLTIEQFPSSFTSQQKRSFIDLPKHHLIMCRSLSMCSITQASITLMPLLVSRD